MTAKATGDSECDLRKRRPAVDSGEAQALPRASGEPARGWQILDGEEARTISIDENGTDAQLRALRQFD